MNDRGDDQPSLEFDIDAILESNPNPMPAALPQRTAAPLAHPTPAVTFPDLITADLLDDQHTISTLGRDQSLLTRDDPPIAMFRPSYDPDRFADEEAPSLPKYSYKQTLRNNKSGEAMRKLNSSAAGESLSNSAGSNRSVSYKDLYIVVTVLGLLLLALITGLAIWLIALKTNDTIAAGSSSIAEEESIWAQPTLSPTRIPTRFDVVTEIKAPTIAPTHQEDATAAPITAEPTSKPTRSPTHAPKASSPTEVPVTDAPTTRPTLSPTSAPTIQQTTLSPTPLPTPESTLIQRARTKFVQVLESQSISAVTPLGQPNTPQYHALNWLIHDPNFDDYSDARLIQRWVLATFAYGLRDADWRDSTATSRSFGISPPPLPQALMNSWVKYTNECTWFYTNVEDVDLCNEEGLYHRIDLRSQNLAGTIPTEIALLSNHLAFLYLYDNEIDGTIPSELMQLKKMERIELTRNHLTGSIPTQIGDLSQSLVFLGLGVNDLNGNLPTEMGKLDRLRTVGLERNRISGTIPTEFGNMVEARLLNLDWNQLTGTVPANLWRMTLLRGLNLGFNNDLVGTIPFPLCEQRLGYLEADCDNVECPCCTTCNRY